MRRGKFGSLFVLFFWMALCLLPSGRAAAAQETEALEGMGEELLDGMDLNQVDDTLEELLGEERFSFTETVKQLISGEIPFTREQIGEILKDAVFSDMAQHKKTAVSVLMLILVSAVFTNFTGAFGKSQVADISFYMMYLLLFTVLMRAFSMMSQETLDCINKVLGFMKVLMPSYLAAAVFASGSLTGVAYYEFTLALIGGIQWILKYVVIPAVNFYVLFSLLNHIAKEDYLSKIADLMKSFIYWSLKTLAAAAIGIQTVQCLILPAVDSFKTAVLNKTAGAIPGVGNIFNSVTEVVLGSAILIKNAIGVAGLIVLALLCAFPMVKLAVCTVLYKVISAVVQPAADKRMAECVSGVGEGAAMLLRTLVTTGILFFISVAMVTASIKGG